MKYIFAGHYHANAGGRDGDLEIVVTGPVGLPLRGAKSGMRFVTVTESGITHNYWELSEIPETLTTQ